jgi:hypothetical protein
MKRRSLLFQSLSIGTLAAAVAACSSSSAAPTESTATATEAVSSSLSWAGWTSLSGGLLTDPSIFAYDRYHVGAVAIHGDLYFNWFDTLRWTGWVDLGSAGHPFATAPVAVRAGNNIEVFAVETNGWLAHREGTFNGTNAPSWGDWEEIWQLQSDGQTASPTGQLATSVRRPPAVVVSQPNNQVNVIATFADNTVKAIRVYGLHNWSFWSDLSGSVNYEPAAVSWGPNRLDVVAVGGDQGLYHRYSDDDGATWMPAGPWWEALEGNAYSTPSIVSWGPNRLDIFASGRPSGGQISGVQHLAWTGDSWGTCGANHCWDSMHMLTWQDGTNGEMAAPVAITRGVGDIEVFAQGIAQELNVKQMTSANPPAWTDWQEFTSCFRTGGAPAVVSPDNVGIDVLITGFASDGNGALYANSTAGGAGFISNGAASPPSCQIGYPGGPCGWPSNSCSEGATCRTDRVCACGPNYVVQTSNGHPVCVEAGNAGEPCFADGSCNPGQLVCRAGTCLASGHAGEPCNAGDPNASTACDSSSACVWYKTTPPRFDCEAAGPVGDWCRWNGHCDPGAACDPQSRRCIAAGQNGERCDSDGHCAGPGLACVAGACELCGNGGNPCCGGDTCFGGLVCGGDKKCAKPAPPPPPPPCRASAPVLGQFTVNHFLCDWPGEGMSIVVHNTNCATEQVNYQLSLLNSAGQLISQGPLTPFQVPPVGVASTIGFTGPSVDGDYIVRLQFDHGLGGTQFAVGVSTECTPGVNGASKTPVQTAAPILSLSL